MTGKPLNIDYRVEAMPGESSSLMALLHEIRQAMIDLLNDQAEACIDLRGVPLGPGQEERLLEILGTGEVSASLDTLGHSSIRETRFPGVWLCIHRNQDGEVMGMFVEVTRVPGILKAQHEDMRDGLKEMTHLLEAI